VGAERAYDDGCSATASMRAGSRRLDATGCSATGQRASSCSSSRGERGLKHHPRPPGAPETKADVADQWVGVMKISRTLARLGA